MNKEEQSVRKWVLVSVFDKTGVVPFCEKLQAAGYGILSTGGTARHLQEAGLSVTQVEDYTGFPEMMDGRVKTLHPKIHGGLLGLRDDAAHVESMQAYGIDEIDVVVVNLYPFEETIAKPAVTFAECVEMIDIGGPSMLRAAAKNYRFVAPVIDPADYTWVADAMLTNGLTEQQRLSLATKVFVNTARYDAAIASYLEKTALPGDSPAMEANQTESADADVEAAWPAVYTVHFEHKQALRYGENPHQKAHFYAERNASPTTIAGAVQHQGKELSYNNIQDADAALNIIRAFDDMGQAAVVAVKHMNPCGVGLADTIEEAFTRAYEGDPVSIFGGIVACNRPVDAALAARLTDLFLEIVMAPAFSAEALAVFAKKKNVRVLEVQFAAPLWTGNAQTFRRVSGGLLVQTVDSAQSIPWDVVTARQPSADERRALEFAWRVVRFVKSNAIVVANHQMTLGIGAGQMNRVGAAGIALRQAGSLSSGAVLASDAFFPMRDTVDLAAAHGIRAIVQPGGSIKDKDSIAAADEHGIAMVFTHSRHFLH